MPFLSPWFLLGALAIAVPIWLHLIRHEQAIRIPFSSLMFFRRIPQKSVSRQRLKYLLLLSARVLLLLLLALAFARPYFPGADRFLAGALEEKHVVILLDTSLSMQYADRWERALDAARDVIADLGERDQAQIVTFASEFQIQNLPTSDQAALRAVLEGGLRPTASTTSYAQAIRAVERIAEDASRPLSVILISDLQESGMGRLPQSLSVPLADGLKLVDVAGNEAPNWALEGVRSRRVIYESRYPDRLLAQVRGFGTPEESKDVVLSLGGKILQRRKVLLPASGTATAVFEGFDVPVGSNKGAILLDPSDNLVADDTFHFTLERREPHRLLFLQQTQESAELYYFQKALAAEPDSPFLIEARTPPEAARLGLEDYAMVILSNIGDIAPSFRSDLRSFVKEGGGALFTMGSRVAVPPLKSPWQELWPGKGIQKRLMTRDGERMVLVGEFEREHPLFREFRESGADSLRSVEVYAYVRLQPEGRVLLRFANGDPALVEKQYGRGRVLLFASSFDNVWSDFPLHPAFIPLVHQMVRYTAQLPEEPPSYRIPTAVSLKDYHRAPQEESADRIWNVMGPDGKREVPLAEEMHPDFLTLRRPGFYEVRQEGNTRLIAANTDPRESDLKPLSPEDRALWMASYQTEQDAPGAGAGSEQTAGRRIWWILLLMAFLLALAEAYLANQYLGTRRTTISPAKAPGSSYAG